MCISKLRGAILGMVSLGLTMLSSAAFANIKWNMPEGVTPISHDVYGLHMRVFYWMVFVAIVVFGTMLWSIVFHRKSKGKEAAHFHHSTTVEIIWTIIPVIILVLMAFPAARTLVKMEDYSKPDMSIRITGYQWKWHYDYVGKNVGFFSTLAASSNKAARLHSGIDPNSVPHYLLNVDHPLVVPTGEKVRLLITSNDVIHSWWVPDFGGKTDAIPGYVNEMWIKVEKPGTYRGQCAELCGRGHAFMPIVVVAKNPQDYQAWLKAQQGGSGEAMAAPAPKTQGSMMSGMAGQGSMMSGMPAHGSMMSGTAAGAAKTVPKKADSKAPAKMTMAELMKQGKQVYDANCAACHQPDGKGMPPTFPALTGSKIVDGPVAGHIDRVLNGKNVMPAWRDKLSDADIAAVVTYERNSFGNKTGDVVQPADVKAAR